MEKESSSVGDVEALLERIRQDVLKACTLDPFEEMPKFEPVAVHPDEGAERKAGELRDAESLRYLNFHYNRTLSVRPESITTHRKGLLAKLIVGLKRKLLVWIGDVMKDYFQDEITYRAHLVRYLNQMATYGDARMGQMFWELIHKIDTDVGQSVQRIEAIALKQERCHRALEQDIREQLSILRTTLQGQERDINERVALVEQVVKGFERLLVASAPSSEGVAELREEVSLAHDPSYVLFENRFRGSEEAISQALASYVPLLQGHGPVFEIGAGRGELQGLCRAAGLAVEGVDIDAAMVARCVEQGYAVTQQDGLAALETKGDATLGAVIAIQVVEHLSQAQLAALFELCRKKVRPGGRVIFETINPRSVVALSSNYFRDPTHVWPLHPDTLGYLMELGGLQVCATDFLSPVGVEAQLPLFEHDAFMSPKWQAMVEKLNDVVGRLNDLLYGYQDYRIVATVPEK